MRSFCPLALLVAGGFLAAAPMSASAQGGWQAANNLTSVSGNHFTIEGESTAFTVDAGTVICLQGKRATSLEGFKVGQLVKIFYSDAPDHKVYRFQDGGFTFQVSPSGGAALVPDKECG
jgi:hypothetical protein